ncbi:MAG: YegS/Rv2252/BmrU family lipid kinase [Bacilli bacterium]|nr:YegS/Rv2252/BmrU family lipid kinase [Bacilli bacterium]
MKKCLLIINPHSGRRHKKFNFEKIRNIFLKYNYDVNIAFTEYKGHAKRLVLSATADLVVSVGGDGTFNEVMTGNFERKNKILISHIPIGTANDIGAMYGYKKSIYKNIELLLSGSVKGIDICTINGFPFTYVAALGKFTNISYDTPRKLKRSFGYLAYLLEGLKELKKKPVNYNIEYYINGEYHKTNAIFMLVSNANRIAGINNFYHDIKLDDNRFEVLFCTLNNQKEIVRSLYHLKDDDIKTLNGFKFYKTNYLKIKFDKPILKGWSIDGEELIDKNEEFEIKIVRNVKILIPNKNIEKLFIKE